MEAPLPPEKLAKPNPSSVGSKNSGIGSEVDDRSLPSFAICPFKDGVATMFEPPSGEPGRVGFGPLVSLLDWPSVLGVIVSVGHISVSTERTDWSEDCPPPQARLQHTRETKRINPRTVEYTGARNGLPSVTADAVHGFKISAHVGFDSSASRSQLDLQIRYLYVVCSVRNTTSPIINRSASVVGGPVTVRVINIDARESPRPAP